MILFFISHLMQVFIFPPGLNLILVILGMIFWKRWHVLSTICLLTSFFSLWLLSLPIVASHLAVQLQSHYPTLQVDSLGRRNSSAAIVILGGGHGFAPEYKNQNAVSESTLNRLKYGAYLYEQTLLPIIVSGGDINGSYSEAELMRDVLRDNFKTPVKWMETQSINTADEASMVLPLLKQNKIKTIYLITNAWHMPRSMYIFNKILNKEGIRVISAPMGYFDPGARGSFLDYLPSLDGLVTNGYVLHEYVGFLWYWIFYRS